MTTPDPTPALHVGKRTEEAKTLVTPQMHNLLAEKARTARCTPQFGIGQHAAAPKDASALAAVRALQGAQFERAEHLARYGDRYTVARQKKSQPVLATPLGHSSTN